MTRPLKLTQGFTLIELLTVIAIIGILAGLIAAGLPRALEKAKIAKLEGTFHQIRTILTEYYVDHGTFPPAYGYLSPAMRGVDPGDILSEPENVAFFLKPWMAYLEQHNKSELFDNFSIAYDTDLDRDIGRLEYSPGNIFDPITQKFVFPNALYRFSPNQYLQDDLDYQYDSQGPRPILYFPVNKRQFRKVAAKWSAIDPDNPRPNDAAVVNEILLAQRFPPPSYDAYVLISVGPSRKTWGMIYELADGPNCLICESSNYEEAYYYHILGMATYFMATRDAEDGGAGDGELDFDFLARTRGDQGKHPGNNLPDPESPNGPGPIIFVGEG